MILNQKTLEKLRQLINEETKYRSGPKIVQFLIALDLVTTMAKASRRDGHTPMKGLPG